MALDKVTYVDGETLIEAQNLNDIQDSIIALEDQTPKTSEMTQPVGIDTDGKLYVPEGSSDTFYAEYGVATGNDVYDAVSDGKFVYTIRYNSVYVIVAKPSRSIDKIDFINFDGLFYRTVSVQGTTWTTPDNSVRMVSQDHLASEYSEATQYYKGDVVKRYSMLYMAKEDTTGNFDSSKWYSLEPYFKGFSYKADKDDLDELQSDLTAEVSRAEAAEALKADLVNGKVPTSQLPDDIGAVQSVNDVDPDSEGNVQLDAGDIYVDGSAENPVTIASALTQQSQQIASLQTSKADKLTEDARYAKHETEIKFLMDAAKGQIAEVHTDTAEAYSKAVPSYTSAQAKFADIKKLGGKSVVRNQWITITDGTYTSNGITFVVSNGIITCNGTSTDTADFNLNTIGNKSPHKILLRGSPSTASLSTYFIGHRSGSPAEAGNGAIITLDSSMTYFRIRVLAGQTLTNVQFVPNYIDLTEWFNGDSTILDSITDPEDAYALGVPRTYIPYNAGEIISADCDSVVSEGFNLWDEKWESGSIDTENGNKINFSNRMRSKNLIPVVPNTTYYMTPGNARRGRGCFYDADGVFISGDPDFPTISGTFTAPSNARFLMFSPPSNPYGGTYLNDICINVSNAELNGTYKPYIGTIDSLSIPAGLRTAHPLRSAGTAYDYLLFKQENGSLKVEHHKKIAALDLGQLSWASRYESWMANITEHYPPITQFTTPNLICPNYTTSANTGTSFLDGCITLRYNENKIAVRDSSFESADAFKQAMNGVYAFFELADTDYVVTDVTSYFPADFGTYLPVEDGGSLTFHQNATEFPVPNTEDFYYVLEGASA